MFFTNKRYLSFSIDESVIKIAQATSSGVVEKVSRVTAADASLDALAASFKTLMTGFDRKANIICSIPANVATTKTIDVPSTDPQEIRSIINLQVSRHTPYSREEVLVSYVNLGLGPSNQTKVLLVIVHRNVVVERIKLLEKVGLNLDKIVFIPEGVGRLYFKCLNLKKDAAPVGLIDVALNTSNFLIIASGSIIFSRSVPVGIKQMIESQESVTKFIDEINKSNEAYNSEDGVPPVDYFLLTTESDVVKNLPASLKEILFLDVKFVPFVQFINASSVKSKLISDFADDSFLDVISSATFALKSEINLMPEELIIKKSVEKQSKEAIKTVAAVFIILILLGSMMMSKIFYKESFLKHKLIENFDSERKQVEQLKESLNQINVIQNYLDKRLISLDVIKELYRITPNQIYLNAISMDEDGVISLVGVSESMSQIFSYVKILSDSPVFTNIKTKSTASKKENGKDLATFELSLQIK